MMEKINDGGPAFPLPLGNENIDPSVGGMSLRDYFAAKTMAGLIGSVGKMSVGVSHPENNLRLAKVSYAIADAMLAAREVKS